MSVMDLPELKTRLHKNDDSPRQSDFLDWLEGLVSAPPLRAKADEAPRQSDFIDWLESLLSAPPLDARN